MADDAQLVMPKLGLTMTEGTITEWRVQPGAAFKAGDIIVVVETEKIANEVEAPAAGTMSAHLVNTGDTVPVGTPIARWNLGAGAMSVATSVAMAPAVPLAIPLPIPPKMAVPIPITPPQPKPVPAPGARIIATPLARRMAKERGVDLRGLAGSGPRGRIKAIDVENAPRAGAASPAPAAAPASFFLMATVRIGEVNALAKKIAALEGMEQVSLTHFICLAAAQALAGDIAISAGGAPAVVLRDTRNLRLSGVIAGLAAAAEGNAVMTITDAGNSGVEYVNAPLPPGQALALGIGAVQAAFRPDAQGKPMLVEEIGLVLTCASAAFDTAAGLKLLGTIKSYLESPLRILAN